MRESRLLIKILLLSIFILSSSAYSATVNIKNYSAVGNGTTNDRAAFDNAIADLLSYPDSEVKTLELEKNKTYFLKRTSSGTALDHIFDFRSESNIVIDGNNSTLLLERYDMAFFVYQSTDIQIKNLKLDYKVPTFTQGVISNINTNSRTFTLTADAGYAMPTDTEIATINARNTNNPWANSSTFTSSGNYLRINLYIEKVEYINKSNRQLKITYSSATTAADYNQLQSGQKFAFRTHGGSEPGHQIEIYKSTNVSVENVAIFNTMKMGINGKYNSGTLKLSNVQIKPKPGTNRLVSAVSDGIHLKSNRAKIIIENSHIERNLDDAINLGAMAEVIHKKHSSTDIEIRDLSIQGPSYIPGNFKSPQLKVGDEVYAFNFNTNGNGILLGKAKITSVSSVNVNGNTERVRRIKLDNAIPGMIAVANGTNIGVAAKNFTQPVTQLFIPNVSNPDFQVVNNTIRDKTRSGMLVKGAKGLIRGNRFFNLDGYGVYARNGLQFNEGPVPINMEISANYFENIGLYGVALGVAASQSNKSDLLVSGSTIVNNRFKVTHTNKITTNKSTRIYLDNISSVNVAGNLFENVNSGIQSLNTSSVTNDAFPPLWQVSGQTGIYFVSNDSYCKIPAMNWLTRVWGANWRDYFTVGDALPVNRTNNGNCRYEEGIVRLASGGLYRYNHDNTMCKYGNMNNFKMSTGMSSAANLPLNNSADVASLAQQATFCQL